MLRVGPRSLQVSPKTSTMTTPVPEYVENLPNEVQKEERFEAP